MRLHEHAARFRSGAGRNSRTRGWTWLVGRAHGSGGRRGGGRRFRCTGDARVSDPVDLHNGRARSRYLAGAGFCPRRDVVGEA
jgi:hypothetical protein